MGNCMDVDKNINQTESINSENDHYQSPTVSGIRFRSLADQLNDFEFNEFVSKLIKSFGRNIILTSLFNSLVMKSDATQSIQMHDIIEIVSDIIKSRNIIINIKSQPATNKFTINSLPDNLFGKIASYLNQDEYSRFSTVNRAVMIGCNTPNTLQYINIQYRNHSAINLQNYPSVKHIVINLQNVNELRLPRKNANIANNLQHLEIHSNLTNNANIDGFINCNQNTLHFKNVNKLSLYCFGESVSNPFNGNKFWQLLSKFTNVEHLILYAVYMEQSQLIPDAEIKKLLPNLKRFTCHDMDDATVLLNKFINLYGNDLEYLSVDDRSAINIHSNVSFNKLEELVIVAPTNQNVRCILKTAKKLKKIWMETSTSINITTQDLINLIRYIICSQSLLEHIYIDVWDIDDYDAYKSVFNGIEQGLHKTKTIHRKYLKITMGMPRYIAVDNLILYMSSISNILQSSYVKEFMLICKFSHGSNHSNAYYQQIQKASDEFNKMAVTVNAYFDFKSHSIVMSNNNCKIDGYSDAVVA